MAKGGWRGGGRPQGSTSKKPTRTVVKQIRWTEDEWDEVERRAEDAEMTPSDYQRAATLGRLPRDKDS